MKPINSSNIDDHSYHQIKLNSKQQKKKSFINLNKFAILAVVLAIILFGLFQFTTFQQWIRLINNLPGSFTLADTNRDILEIIKSRGFDYEQHFLTTEDGYILQLVRIINPFVKNKDKRSLKPVLLHHGFQYTGVLWLIATNGRLNEHGIYQEFDEQNNLLNEDKSKVGNTLGFVLASRGFDVWLATYRGGIYSTNHTTLNVDSPEYWKFSIDHMIKYDIPAEIDYILAKTKHSTLGYIGHSQGNLMPLALMSVNDKYSKIIDPFIALSPVFYQKGIKSALTYFFPFKGMLRSFPTMVPFSNRTRLLLTNFCENKFTLKLCYYIANPFFGSQLNNLIWERIPLYLLPSGSSSWNAAHLFQMMSSNNGECSYFDYGEEENMKIYRQSKSPIYDAGKINSTKIALVYTADDWLNHLDSVNSLKQKLIENNGHILDDYQIPDPSYNHMDMIFAKNVGELVNDRILRLLSSKP